jgi:hypothetical protein
MLALSRMGVRIVPSMPAFYNRPQTVEDIVDYIVARLEQARDRFWTIRLTHASILVRRGIDRHELDPGTDPELLLEALGGPLHLHVLLRNRPADHDYVSRLVALTLDGARPRQ